MSYNVEFAGNSAGGYIISGARTEKLCLPGQEWEVLLDLNCPLSIKPWTAVEIYENGTKVLTGYTASVGRVWAPDPVLAISGVDTWKRATDCWNTEEYVTGNGDTIQSLIRRFLDMAGLSYQFTTAFDEVVPAGLSILYQPVSEIVLDLCSALGLFVRVNADGWVIIGDVVSDGGTGDALDNEIIAYDMLESDYRARNKVIVWGPRNMAIVRSDEDRAVVDHTMVFASPYAYDAWGLANVMWSNLHTTEKIKTIDHPGDPDRKVGQRVYIDSPDDSFDDYDICTTLKSDYGKEGYVMQSVFGERCAIFGHGPSPIDGRDIIVATKECGVWRCLDIWADTPIWYSLNGGLEEEFQYGGETLGSTFDCEWFIRDPFLPNTMCFLLTAHGIMVTHSTEPSSCEWSPRMMNVDLNPYFIDASGFYTARLRSTVAREGAYYAVVSLPEVSGWGRTWGAITNDRFKTLHFGVYEQSSGGGIPSTTPIMASVLIGNECNYGYQENVAMATWHRDAAYLRNNVGGLAAWHRNDYGCTVTALSSAPASNASSQYWELMRSTVSPHYGGGVVRYCEPDSQLIPSHGNVSRGYGPFKCWLTGTPLTPETSGYWPYGDGKVVQPDATSWLICPSLHIPYDQVYDARGRPTVYYFTPGYAEGSAGTGITALAPTRNGVPLLLPWGTNPGLCHRMQGSIGSYTNDERKLYCFSGGTPSYAATSEDRGDTWTSRGSVPFATSCFSGFPTSAQKVYAGRDPNRDPSDGDDRALIYVSWDRGETWADVTGDLWEKTQALNLRQDDGGNPLGTAGLVTIAPRYC